MESESIKLSCSDKGLSDIDFYNIEKDKDIITLIKSFISILKDKQSFTNFENYLMTKTNNNFFHKNKNSEENVERYRESKKNKIFFFYKYITSIDTDSYFHLSLLNNIKDNINPNEVLRSDDYESSIAQLNHVYQTNSVKFEHLIEKLTRLFVCFNNKIKSLMNQYNIFIPEELIIMKRKFFNKKSLQSLPVVYQDQYDLKQAITSEFKIICNETMDELEDIKNSFEENDGNADTNDNNDNNNDTNNDKNINNNIVFYDLPHSNIIETNNSTKLKITNNNLR